MEDAIAHEAGIFVSKRFSSGKGWAISPDFEDHFPDVACPGGCPTGRSDAFAPFGG